MEYVVMALFDEKTNECINMVRKDIKEIAKRELAGGWIPHITLGVYQGTVLEDLKKYVRSFANVQKKIPSTFDVIGQFLHNDQYPETDVFVFIPAQTPELISFYKKFHEKFDNALTEVGRDYLFYGGTSTIHSSVAICDTESFLAVMAVLYEKFKRQKIVITGIRISDMNQNTISEYEFGE